jgi:hypothetical protein
MSVLSIGTAEREQIARMIELARAKPVPLALVARADMTTKNHKGKINLKDRDPALIRPPSQHIVFSGDNVRAAFSFEEQPGGLYSHLSISLLHGRPGSLPHPAAIIEIAKEFGVPFPPDHGWLEEYEPGEYAINLVSFYSAEREAGHA